MTDESGVRLLVNIVAHLPRRVARMASRAPAIAGVLRL